MGEPKVGNFRVVVTIEKYSTHWQVPMRDTEVMQMPHAQGESE